MGNMDQSIGEEGWQWSPAEEALNAVVLWKIQKYVWRRQAIIEN